MWYYIRQLPTMRYTALFRHCIPGTLRKKGRFVFHEAGLRFFADFSDAAQSIRLLRRTSPGTGDGSCADALCGDNAGDGNRCGSSGNGTHAGGRSFFEGVSITFSLVGESDDINWA